MQTGARKFQYLLSLPARMAAELDRRVDLRGRKCFAAAAVPNGASANVFAALLDQAWRQAQADGQTDWKSWLTANPAIILLDASPPSQPIFDLTGRPLLPMPVLRWARGQRLDQTLLDLQVEALERVLREAGSHYLAVVSRNDVLLHPPAKWPVFPQADVLGLGRWEAPGEHLEPGAFYCPRHEPGKVAFYLSEPPEGAPDGAFSADFLRVADAGVWLLSAKAVETMVNFQPTGVSAKEPATAPRKTVVDFFRDWGTALGTAAKPLPRQTSRLSAAAIPLPAPVFFRFQTARQVVESVSALQNIELDESKLGLMGAKRRPDQYLQNARFDYALRVGLNNTLWVENSVIPASWQLASQHVLTGVPPNDWDLHLTPGTCLDFVPMAQSRYAVRFYHLDDPFSSGSKLLLGRPFADWFEQRQLPVPAAPDLLSAPVFPLLAGADLDPRFLEWLFHAAPPPNRKFRDLYLASRRLASCEMAGQVNLRRLFQQRETLRRACLKPMRRNFRYNVFFKLDLESTARDYAARHQDLPRLKWDSAMELDALQQVHDKMFRSAVMRHRGQPGWETLEFRAFALLRNMIVQDARLSPALPRRCLQEDQIVWGRSPVRLDFAGGWSDTPPYCLEYGGKVVNAAVDLNGQPPIQVFAKLNGRPELVLRSIDLGVEQKVRTYQELDTFAAPGSEFALAKAAFALAGFLPRFNAAARFSTLKQQLQDFGGGIELSLLSAVPKGSGLGTSSILAATILATLNDLAGLHWDRDTLFLRTLALEQMLTTGGGWQDQAGAIYRGLKLIETVPGLKQKPTLRWLPNHLLERDCANRMILLYYTGVTRLAKKILQEIVRGIFLNSPSHLRVVSDIAGNAERAFQAIQECRYDGLAAAIQTSWELNQALDAGTNPPEIQAILAAVSDFLLGAKLLGAGGGGYLLMLAKDETAASRVRARLTEHPPNPRARFVQFALSETGLQVTRS